jgi:hypothetical protein
MRKATFSFVMSVALFVRPSACLSVRWASSGQILMKFGMSICRKSARKIQVSLKSDKNNGHSK